VLPKEFGVQLKPWFICTPTFWLGERQSSTDTRRSLDALSQADVEDDDSDDDAAIEPVSAGLKSLISLRGLRKTFSTPAGTKVAVHSLSLDCFENQITALLGHNGAGERLGDLLVHS
jgi:ABC-type transport system involved in cytochrome bd biosynthesis fused ATPase/permease subunit